MVPLIASILCSLVLSLDAVRQVEEPSSPMDHSPEPAMLVRVSDQSTRSDQSQDGISSRDLSPEPPIFLTIRDRRSLYGLPREMITQNMITQRVALTVAEMSSPGFVLACSLREATHFEKGFEAVREAVAVPAYKDMLIAALHGNILTLLENEYGHRVIVAMIRAWNLDDLEFILDELKSYEYRGQVGYVGVAQHRLGSRVLHALLKLDARMEASESPFASMTKELMRGAPKLALDSYGHEVVSDLIRYQGAKYQYSIKKLFEALLVMPTFRWRKTHGGDLRYAHFTVLRVLWEHPPTPNARYHWAYFMLKQVQEWLEIGPLRVQAAILDVSGNALFREVIKFASETDRLKLVHMDVCAALLSHGLLRSVCSTSPPDEHRD